MYIIIPRKLPFQGIEMLQGLRRKLTCFPNFVLPFCILIKKNQGFYQKASLMLILHIAIQGKAEFQ